jgi:hypothetical protein
LHIVNVADNFALDLEQTIGKGGLSATADAFRLDCVRQDGLHRWSHSLVLRFLLNLPLQYVY